MSDIMNEVIQDVAVKHGVVLGKDDPILMLQTMHERLIEENRRAQQEMLGQFKEEMENISSQWKDDAKEKAEKVLNAALAGSKELMDKIFKESARESILVINKMVSDSLNEAHALTKQTRAYSLTSLLSTTILTGTCLAVCFSIIF